MSNPTQPARDKSTNASAGAKQQKRRWPDMSAYGIHFGVVDMPNGERRMVMVDEEGSWTNLAKAMGFSQSRWFGLYVKSSLKLDIPGFAVKFPRARVVEMTDQEIRSHIHPLIRARRDQRLSQMAAGAGRRMSWHPTRTEISSAAGTALRGPTPESVATETISRNIDAAEAVAEAASAAEAAADSVAGELATGANTQESADDAALSLQQALRQTLYLGMNHLGQDVYESGDGRRFVRAGDAVIARETDDVSLNPMFLRAGSDADLVLVARGMVQEMDAGRRLHSDDFIRFVDAGIGAGAHDDSDSVNRFHRALDVAIRERMAGIGSTGLDAFNEALRLHEGRPSYWRSQGTMPTPLPISVVMQSLVHARISAAALGGDVNDSLAPVVIDLSAHVGSHSWSLDAATVAGGEPPPHDIAVAGVFSRPNGRATSLSGVRVTRDDTEALLQSLSRRRADGLTVFLVSTDTPGKLDSELRRVLSAVGQNYEICGITDIDAAMIGAGVEASSRLIVIGNKRAAAQLAFAVPAVVPVVYDYESLWTWGESLRAAEFGESQTFGDDGREENRWQAPYVPSSQVSEPEAMSPRNLLGPVRKALARIVERNQMGIDEFVCARLGWTMEQLESRLSSEQTDAVALGIQSLDDGMGMVEADATGMGKGRVAAAMAVYARKKGLNVMFMTEKADLFVDFYRDVNDIGSMDVLGKPFIVNNDLILRENGTPDGREIGRSPKREVASNILACGESPLGAGYDITLATYSQFNRVYDAGQANRGVLLSRAVRGLLDGSMDPMTALMSCREHLSISLPDYPAMGYADTASAADYERQAAAAVAGQALVETAHNARADFLLLPTDKLAKELGDMTKSDMTMLKHRWVHSAALEGAFLVLDESHIAAGADSQTGANLRQLVDRATSVVYSSATFAKDTNNFALYGRLFPKTLRASTISETLDRGGEPMQEILSAMLAEDGRLVRREHDLSSIEFKVSVDAERKGRNEQWANAFAQILASMSYMSGEVEDLAIKLTEAAEKALRTSKHAVKANNASTPRVGVQYTNFSSKFYNLSRAFSLAVNADLAADLAIRALKEGRKPVITVENTMESVLKELVDGVELEATPEDSTAADANASPASAVDAAAMAAAQLGALDPLAGVAAGGPAAPAATAAALDPLAGVADGDAAAATKAPRVKRAETIDLGRTVGFRDILLAYIDTMFVARQQTRKAGKVIASRSVNLLTPEMQEAVTQIKALIAQMPDVPLSPMDLVRERVTAAGYTIDEISGRKLALRTNEDGTHSVARMGERKKGALKNAFNAGQLDALILSRSGSTGISLHANRTFSDVSQRELIELQPAADIAQRLQFWGRVNRKGQVCSPIIHMVSSGLPAEMRLITMQNAKLRKMSANISSNADNSAINENAPDILNRIGNEIAFRWLENNPKISAVLGYSVGEMAEDQANLSGTKFIDLLTGRLMMLDVETQRRVYAELTQEFRAVIEQCEQEGRNPLKSAEFDLRAARTATMSLQVASGQDSVFNEGVHATELSYQVSVGALDRDAITAEAEAGRLALEAKFGKDYASVAVQQARDQLDQQLTELLPKRFETVEAAMASDKPNAVKNAESRMEYLREKLPRLQPGSIVCFGDGGSELSRRNSRLDGAGSFLEKVFITEWKLPEHNKLPLSAYKLCGYSALTRKRVEMTLSAMSARASMFIDTSYGVASPAGVSYEADLDWFFKGTNLPMTSTQKQVILDGNLYRAAEIAESQKQGSAITYTDEHGVWHHAILMPKAYSMKNVGELPVAIDSAETLLAAVAARPLNKERLMITDDLRRGTTGNIGAQRSYAVFANSQSVLVSVTGGAESTSWLINDSACKACLRDGQFKGSRTSREGRVIPGREEQFLLAFMQAANAGGAKVLISGEHRAWYNQYLQERAAAATGSASQVLDKVMASEEDDELASLLSASPAM